jgi:hypothetical protein
MPLVLRKNRVLWQPLLNLVTHERNNAKPGGHRQRQNCLDQDFGDTRWRRTRKLSETEFSEAKRSNGDREVAYKAADRRQIPRAFLTLRFEEIFSNRTSSRWNQPSAFKALSNLTRWRFS